MINIFNKFIKIIQDNKKKVFSIFILIISLIIISQIYIFYNENKIFKQSVSYYSSQQIQSQEEFIIEMESIKKSKGFYSILASLEIIKKIYISQNYEESYWINGIGYISKLEEFKKNKSFFTDIEVSNINQNYEETYSQYISLLNKNNIDSLYKSLIAINASYDLINYLDNEKIIELLSYTDDSIESFIGYKKEILFLLSLLNQSKNDKESLYNEIINDEKISSSIKSRVKKIYDFEKYN